MSQGQICQQYRRWYYIKAIKTTLADDRIYFQKHENWKSFGDLDLLKFAEPSFLLAGIRYHHPPEKNDAFLAVASKARLES